MIRKQTLILAVITAIVCTFLVTSAYTSVAGVGSGSKVVLSKGEYEALKSSQSELEQVNKLKQFIQSKYYKDTSDIDFATGQIKGLFESLDDPYSVYMTPEEFKSFNEDSSGEYAGVGIVVEPSDDGIITVVSPIDGTPADKAGIRTGDRILKVDGTEVTADEFDKAISMIKGKPGTEVTLELYRKGDKDTFTIKIVREIIKVDAVKSKTLDGKVLYVKISSFDDDVAAEFEKALSSVEGMKGLVIDLRGNPGGSLDECVQVTDRILSSGLIVYTKDRDGEEERFEADSAESVDVPVAVLVDGGSASASEILTGALKDNKKAVIVGSKTFGKGVVQSIFDMEDGSGIKLTTSEYFTPGGKNIHGIGIEPDIKLDDDPKTKKDESLERALVELEKK